MNPDTVNAECLETMSLPQEVLVNFQYEYTTREGKQVSIKPNERYILVTKTNDHWWHVRKDEATKPFFIPAQYVTVLSPENETTQLPSEQDEKDTAKSLSPVPLELDIIDQKSIKTAIEKDEHRISKFVIPFENQQWEAQAEPELEPCNLDNDAIQMDISRDCSTNYFSPVKVEGTCASTNSQRTAEESSENQSNKNPQNDLNDDIRMLIRAGWDPKIWDLKEESIYESIDSVKDSGVQDTKHKRKVMEELTLASPVSPSFISPTFSPQQSPGSPTDMPSILTEKVQSNFTYSS